MSTAKNDDGPRIASLDGIRGIAMLVVLFAHLLGTQGFLPSNHTFSVYGYTALRSFFVLSGFLITTLLVSEYAKYGTISLLRFYFRRTFRIFPVYYFYILCIVGASALGWVTLKEYDVLCGLTYTTNYHHDRSWPLGHLWSMAVEEQFYMLWPALFLLGGPRGAKIFAASCLVLSPVVRVVTFMKFPEYRSGIGETFPTVFDSIATGCLLALYRSELEAKPWYVRLQTSRMTPFVAALVIAVVQQFGDRVTFSYPIGETICNFALAVFIDWAVRHPASGLGRVLNNRWVMQLGVVSYSVYLFQQCFLDHTSTSTWTSFPLNLACAFALGLTAHYLIERPFLEWRVKLDRKFLPRRKSQHQRQTQGQVAPVSVAAS